LTQRPQINRQQFQNKKKNKNKSSTEKKIQKQGGGLEEKQELTFKKRN